MQRNFLTVYAKQQGFFFYIQQISISETAKYRNEISEKNLTTLVQFSIESLTKKKKSFLLRALSFIRSRSIIVNKRNSDLTWRIFDEIDLGVDHERDSRDYCDRPGRENETSGPFEAAHRIDTQRMTDSQISLHGESHYRENRHVG